MTDTATRTPPIDSRSEQSAARSFYATNGRAINSAIAFFAVWAFFASWNWPLFTNPGLYGSYLFSVPPSIILATAPGQVRAPFQGHAVAESPFPRMEGKRRRQ